MKIGILAVQGAFAEHKKILESLGAECVEIRQLKDLDGIDGLVLPGGESTVQGQLLHKLGLFEPLANAISHGLPTLATCAGLILLAESIDAVSPSIAETEGFVDLGECLAGSSVIEHAQCIGDTDG